MPMQSLGALDWQQATARLEMLPGNVLALRMSGVLTAAALTRFAAQASAEHGRATRAFLLDYRAGLLVISAEEMATMVGATPALSAAKRLPGAYVSGIADGGMLRAHAVGMALAGFTRRAFYSDDDAHRWLLRRSKG